MRLEALDWTFVVAFFAISLAIGLLVARRAGRNTSEFFPPFAPTSVCLRSIILLDLY